MAIARKRQVSLVDTKNNKHNKQDNKQDTHPKFCTFRS